MTAVNFIIYIYNIYTYLFIIWLFICLFICLHFLFIYCSFFFSLLVYLFPFIYLFIFTCLFISFFFKYLFIYLVQSRFTTRQPTFPLTPVCTVVGHRCFIIIFLYLHLRFPVNYFCLILYKYPPKLVISSLLMHHNVFLWPTDLFTLHHVSFKISFAGFKKS